MNSNWTLMSYRELKKQIKKAVAELGTVLELKGVVTDTSKLPLTGNKKGDVYVVSEDNTEYVWTSDNASGLITDYEELGPVISGPFLPEANSSDVGKVVMVENDSSYGLENIPSQLPAVTASDAGKVLTVQASVSKGAVIVPSQSVTVDQSAVDTVNSDASLFTVGAQCIATINGTDYVGTVESGKATHISLDDGYMFSVGDDVIAFYAEQEGTYSISLNIATISGEWVAQTPASGGGVLVVTDTDGALNKTWQEIADADLAVVIVGSESNTEHLPVYYVSESTHDVSCMTMGRSGAVDRVYRASSASGYPELQS